MNTFLSTERSASAQHLSSAPLDVLVVGGGITGSGVARDAAMRGLQVGLIDRHDFAFGTSSRSSRLLHGGLRYLEQGRIGLVHEASVEKKIVHTIAPHLAEPLAFVFPSYRRAGRPLWQLRVGVKIYDWLCGGRNFQPSRSLDRAATLTAFPALAADDLRGAVRYFDALTNDARLVLDTLRSAALHGATVLNYVALQAAERRHGLWSCQLHDELADRTLVVHARTVVNATGPWAQQLPHSAVRLRLTKGVHLVVHRQRLPVDEAVVLTQGRRILFVIPWGERVIIGTTDTDYQSAPETVGVSPDDVSYLLQTVNTFFPRLALAESDLVSAWAGLRPLIARPDGSPSDISRSHEIKSPEPGWWDVAGGKLTTYRLMAEQTVDRIARYLAHPAPRSRTAEEPLLPPELLTPYSAIIPPPCTRAAVEHYVTREWAAHLDDVMLRRSRWHYYHPNADVLAAQVAAWMAALLAWSPELQQQELARYRHLAAAERPFATP